MSKSQNTNKSKFQGSANLIEETLLPFILSIYSGMGPHLFIHVLQRIHMISLSASHRPMYFMLSSHLFSHLEINDEFVVLKMNLQSQPIQYSLKYATGVYSLRTRQLVSSSLPFSFKAAN